MPMPEFQELCNEAKKEIREIQPDDLKRMLDANEDFELIDVREPQETSKGALPGAVEITRGLLEYNIDKVTTDKDRKLVLYCAGGNRSALSAWMLQKMGFRNVLSLAGGYRGWKEKFGGQG